MSRILLPLMAALYLAPAAAGGSIDGRVAEGSASLLTQPMVVWLEGLPAGKSPAHPVLAQRGGQFVPPFLVVVAGQTINLPNEDNVAHNVYSLSDTKPFNLGFYAKGDPKSVTFTHAGLVDIRCVIHNFMRAKVLVVPNRYYARVAGDGTFHIRNVPAGHFKLTFWGEGIAPYSQDVTVPKNNPVAVRVA